MRRKPVGWLSASTCTRWTPQEARGGGSKTSPTSASENRYASTTSPTYGDELSYIVVTIEIAVPTVSAELPSTTLSPAEVTVELRLAMPLAFRVIVLCARRTISPSVASPP